MVVCKVWIPAFAGMTFAAENGEAVREGVKLHDVLLSL